MVYACGKGEIAAVIEGIRREDGCWITMSEFIYSHVRYNCTFHQNTTELPDILPRESDQCWEWLGLRRRLYHQPWITPSNLRSNRQVEHLDNALLIHPMD